MKLNILQDNKRKLEFEMEGEDHTVCNALKQQLWQDDNVKVATYRIDHPLVGVPRFLVETDQGETAKDAVLNAAKELQKQNDKFLKNFKKEAK